MPKKDEFTSRLYIACSPTEDVVEMPTEPLPERSWPRVHIRNMIRVEPVEFVCTKTLVTSH